MTASSALLLLDLQNDFLHSNGAYGRAGLSSPDIAVLPTKLRPLADRLRKQGGLIGATLFTLVPGKGGEPMISPHLVTRRGERITSSQDDRSMTESPCGANGSARVPARSLFRRSLRVVTRRGSADSGVFVVLAPHALAPRVTVSLPAWVTS